MRFERTKTQFVVAGLMIGALSISTATAQFTNAGFESGFTSGVGNGWTIFGNPSNSTGSDSTSIKHGGSHAQKIDFPSAPSDGGVFQTVSTTAGQLYRVNFWIYTSAGSEAFDEANMESFFGVDSLGRNTYNHSAYVSNADWNVGWIRLSIPRSSRNTWLNFDREFLAVGSSATIFIRSHRKAAVGMSMYLDDFSISTVSQSSVSTPGIVAPPTEPTLNGGNMLTNADFENGFTNGVGNGWTGWTATGSGSFGSPNNVSKIGGGHYNGATYMESFSATSTVAFAMPPGLAMLTTVKNNDPDILTCGRVYIDEVNFWDVSDAETIDLGEEHAENSYDESLSYAGIDCWQGYNEPWVETLERARKVALFEKAFTERCHELGIRSMVLNLAVGTPSSNNNPMWKEVYAIADFQGYHAYGGPAYGVQVASDELSFALAMRDVADYYETNDLRFPPVIYTEGGTYGPWKNDWSASQIKVEYAAFGPKMMADEWCIGETIFTLGCFGFWCGWDIDNAEIINHLSAWNTSNPAHSRGGKSQRITHTGSAAFTGGIAQAFSTVASGTYWFNGWLKYMTGNGGDPVDPDMAVQIGYDLTGQTSNPNAGSIVWGSDEIATRYLPSHMWHPFAKGITATGTQTSVWIRSHQPSAGTSGRLFLDALEVHASGSTQPPNNNPPTAVASGLPTSGTAPLQVSFDGTGSSDPDMDTLTYTWAWDDGTSNGSGATPTHTFTSAGTYDVVLTVNDGNGGSDQDTVTITVSAGSCTNGNLSNTGFESGLSPWTTFGNTDGQLSNGFYGINARTGTKMFGAGIGSSTQNGGGYQQVTVCDGADLQVTTYIYTKQSGGANWDVNCRIGIDPTGGTNPSSGNITWTGWNNSQNAWSQIGLTGGNSVTASGTTATIFLEHEHKWALSTNVTLFDDVVLTATGGGGGGSSPTISLSLSTLSPSVQQGGNPNNATFTVSNSGTGTLSYSVSDNVSWLSVSPTSGTSTGEADTITVTYATSGLSPNTYNGTITVSDPNSTNNPQTIAVTLTVTAPPPVIGLSTSSLSASTNEGSSPSNQTFTVENDGGGTLSYTVSDNMTWLSVSPTSGTSTGEADTITVSYSTSGLAPGTHNATITVDDSNATNGPQTIAVTLTVNALPATITRSPSTLARTITQGQNAAAQTFTVQNTGGSTTLNYTITDNVSWLSVSPTSGTSNGEVDTINVTYATTGLGVGTHNGTITISDPNATNNPQTIAVTVTVNSSGPLTVTEDFQTMPSWSSTFNASWGSAASFSINGTGQSGNSLRATRSSGGSSVRVKVYSITASTSYTISVYMRAGSSGSTYWTECAYRLGSHTAQNFDQSSGSWTMIKKFDNGGTNGNGNTWVQYSKTFNSGSNTQISVGFKAGSSGGGYPEIRWDTLRVQ